MYGLGPDKMVSFGRWTICSNQLIRLSVGLTKKCVWIYMVIPLLIYKRPSILYIEARGYDIGLDNEASECEYNFISQRSKLGTFSSPHYPRPYPGNLRCKYQFHGEPHERVQIQFQDIDLNYDSSISRQIHMPSCDESYIDAVIVLVRIGDSKRKIARYCFEMPYYRLMSSDNTMEVDFISQSGAFHTARGFNATYWFVSDYGIKTGIHVPNKGCTFHFRSHRQRNGTFTSPNFPGIYPRNTLCTYEFFGQDFETVDITFPFFDVEGIPPRCYDSTQSDYVEFSQISVNSRHNKRMCGKTGRNTNSHTRSPGNYLRITFKSNDVYDGVGFKGVFRFLSLEGSNGHTMSVAQRMTSGAIYDFSAVVCLLMPLMALVISS